MFEAGASSGLMAGLFTGGIALPHLAASGNPDLLDRFVRPTLAGETIGALAVTEPGGGSDVAGIHTTAVRDGDCYVVDGTKTFITSGVRADFVTTAVRTGGPGHAGISLLVIEKGTPGFTVDRTLTKMGWHCSDTAELGFAACRVPAANLVGAEGSGFAQIAQQFVVERIAPRGARLRHRRPVAGPHRGVLPRARDLRQAADRQPGRAAQARGDAPPGRGGADLCARRRGAARRRRRRGRRRVPGQADRGRDRRRRLRRGRAAARRHGYLHGTEVERHYRDARILPIGGGATEVLTDLAARLLGYGR